MNRNYYFITAAFIGIMATSCKGIAESQMTIMVNGEEYVISEAENDTIDLLTLSTEFDAQISVKSPKNLSNIMVNNTPLKDGTGSVHVDSIAKDYFLTLCWDSDTGKDTIYLRTLHSSIPQPTAYGKATSKGDFYLSFVNLRLIEKMDNEGKILFYRYDPIPIDCIDSTKCPGWWDFKKHSIGDSVYYSYHAPDPDFYDCGFPGYNPGMRIILNQHYQPIDTLQLLESRNGTIKTGDPIDGHDFLMFNRNHYIMSSYVKIDDVYAAYLQEVDSNKVVFDWLSTDYIDKTNWLDSAFQKSAGPDYVHFNAIDTLPDGNWLCSFRHISSIVKINRVENTGDILWRLGGAEGDSLYAFHGQHYARYHEKDSTITLFNNGNGTGRTQMLRLKVNPNTGEVSKATILHDDGYYTQACGALTFSGDNMIVGWGIPGDSINFNNRLLTEYDKSDAAIFSISRPYNYYNVNAALGSYRCVKYK